MSINKIYNRLVVLLPIIYLVHNAEEWFLFKVKISVIVKALPAGLREYIVDYQHYLVTIFSVAIIIATVIPLGVAILIWNKPTKLNAKILFVAGLVTLVNGISHISSSFMLGTISPGFITGIILCIPYGIIIFDFFSRNFQIAFRNYLMLIFISIGVFLIGITSIWGIAYLFVSIF